MALSFLFIPAELVYHVSMIVKYFTCKIKVISKKSNELLLINLWVGGDYIHPPFLQGLRDEKEINCFVFTYF